MKIHFLNGDTKEDVSQEDANEIATQMSKDGATHVILKKGEDIYLACKISQILYID